MNSVEHQGVVDSIKGKSMRVRIEQSSACRDCCAQKLCSSADKQDKLIDILSFFWIFPCRTVRRCYRKTLLESAVFAFSTAIGFGLALVLFAGIREQLSYTKIPKEMQGMPIALITAGLLSLAFMGFAGIV